MLSLNQIEELAKEEYDAYKIILGTNGRATNVIFKLSEREYYSRACYDFQKEVLKPEGYECWSWSYGRGKKGFEVLTIRTNI